MFNLQAIKWILRKIRRLLLLLLLINKIKGVSIRHVIFKRIKHVRKSMGNMIKAEIIPLTGHVYIYTNHFELLSTLPSIT